MGLVQEPPVGGGGWSQILTSPTLLEGDLRAGCNHEDWTDFLHFNLFQLEQGGSCCGGFPGGSVVKNLPAMRETRFDPRVRKIPWRSKRQPTPVFWPGESHGQRSLENTGVHRWFPDLTPAAKPSRDSRQRLPAPSPEGLRHPL
ncbi:unnamed protein product [Rangifer tarandus platyrhynchus]|uniref:Uncharacterized protein n=2 Tax=Rangifer tarandus platyrhynchus TaxID=3082113 RepID=A0ABN8XWA7_RANTA|nr:unnamed protein product [Rangifer tarandus platyrhynchus]